jgi:hypothetical protein
MDGASDSARNDDLLGFGHASLSRAKIEWHGTPNCKASTIPTASTARAALDLFEGFCLDGAQR